MSARLTEKQVRRLGRRIRAAVAEILLGFPPDALPEAVKAVVIVRTAQLVAEARMLSAKENRQ